MGRHTNTNCAPAPDLDFGLPTRFPTPEAKISSRLSLLAPPSCRSGPCLLSSRDESSPSSSAVTLSASDWLFETLAFAHLGRLRRVTPSLVPQVGVCVMTPVPATRPRRGTTCRDGSIRPTGAQAASRASARRAPRRPVWGGYGGDKPLWELRSAPSGPDDRDRVTG